MSSLTAKTDGAIDILGTLGFADFPVVSITVLTKTIVVTGDMTAAPGALVEDDDISLLGTVAADGNYTVHGPPVYASGPDTTTIVVHEPIAGANDTTGNCFKTLAAEAADAVDANGIALTQGSLAALASLTDLVTGGGTLTLTGNFACPDVQQVPIIVPDTKTSLIDFRGGAGCQYSGSGNAIECQTGGTVTDVLGDLTNSGAGIGAYNNAAGFWSGFSGNLTNSGAGYGAYNAGTWTYFNGNLINSGAGYGAGNFGGTWTDFSGDLTNSGEGYGAYNFAGTWTDFSGNLINSGAGYGAYNNNFGTWTDFSGTLTNSGTGYGAYSAGTWTDFSGDLTNNGDGTGAGNAGTWGDFSGDIFLGSIAWYPDFSAATATLVITNGFTGTVQIAPQADLSAANILLTKTVLGVAGTLDVAAAEAAAAAAQLVTDKAEVAAKTDAIVEGTNFGTNLGASGGLLSKGVIVPYLTGIAAGGTLARSHVIPPEGTLDIAADNPPATIIRCGG